MKPRFKISLAQWSLHSALKAGELDNLDFPRIARENFGFNAIEWSSQFAFVEHPRLGDQPKDKAYLTEVKRITDDLGLTSLLIMCDHVGNLGDPDNTLRSNAVEGHYAWVEAAKFLGCHSIRVNAASDPSISSEEQRKLCIDGLGRVCTFAQPHGLNVIVENHGGLSSNGAWLASVISGVGLDNCGTLPDFGNFYVARNRGNSERYALDKEPYENDSVYREDDIGLEYDRYQGVADLMPFAKGVSAKSHDFDAQGNEVNTDYRRILKIVADSGYSGYIGIEYEGSKTPEMEGIRLTKTLIERTLASLHQST
ncbi:MAG: sugar phosphate isomerase/epimerase [Verrucomicrobia bacterium]|nr:sugar phosphate isomerase/epimerase [Verrucomicrobiota bacterium]MDA1069193.1 sugar phosphate isomerase/epimerase [Verrucomicrobiota bacterium]